MAFLLFSFDVAGTKKRGGRLRKLNRSLGKKEKGRVTWEVLHTEAAASESTSSRGALIPSSAPPFYISLAHAAVKIKLK